ncbi:MAG: uroporphyrinogen-III synthase, partial [Sphingomicrobium sp.]
MRKLLLLRPEPGLSESAARAAGLGLDVIVRPLFRIEPVEWKAPDPTEYDALLLTSANAVRQAGPGLAGFRGLPAYAIGAATAEAAETAGLQLAGVGRNDIEQLLTEIPGSPKLLHLAGEHRREPETAHSIDRVTVYRSATIDDPDLPSLNGLVVAIHSPRAAARLAELANSRDRTAIAAISSAAADACGPGWE